MDEETLEGLVDALKEMRKWCTLMIGTAEKGYWTILSSQVERLHELLGDVDRGLEGY